VGPYTAIIPKKEKKGGDTGGRVRGGGGTVHIYMRKLRREGAKKVRR